jgi:hypothetical protein
VKNKNGGGDGVSAGDSPVALESACGTDECGGIHSATCTELGVFEWPHARPAGYVPATHAHPADATPDARTAGHSLIKWAALMRVRSCIWESV